MWTGTARNVKWTELRSGSSRARGSLHLLSFNLESLDPRTGDTDLKPAELVRTDAPMFIIADGDPISVYGEAQSSGVIAATKILNSKTSAVLEELPPPKPPSLAKAGRFLGCSVLVLVGTLVLYSAASLLYIRLVEPPVTAAEYDLLSKDMSYDEVVSIVGAPGRLTNRYGKAPDNPTRKPWETKYTEVFEWTHGVLPGYRVLTATFKDGRLVELSDLNLLFD